MNKLNNNYTLNELANRLARTAWNRSNEQMMERARYIRKLAESVKSEVSVVVDDQEIDLDETKKIKKEIDKLFSKYIRLRDAKKTTGTLNRARCITCNKVDLVNNMDAGHYISRMCTPTRWNSKNVHAQCIRCNRFEQGKPELYKTKLIEKYGIIAVEDLELLKSSWVSGGIMKFTKKDLLDFKKELQKKIKMISS